MGPFYALGVVDKFQDDVSYRYLATFVNREAADEWWRMISTPPSPYVGTVRRISPQFYTHNPNVINAAVFFTRPELPEAKQFFEKMFFTLLNDRDGRYMSVAPPVEITDHISGNWFFIRSKADHRRFWYFRVDGACLVCGDTDCDTVHVSTEFRSRFCIQVRNLAIKDFQVPKDFVMIGSDEVSIAASKEYILRINDAEELKATKACQCGCSSLLFSDLRNRFSAHAERLGDDGPATESVVPVERGYGETWELVG